jgi:hypothetical protein
MVTVVYFIFVSTSEIQINASDRNNSVKLLQLEHVV